MYSVDDEMRVMRNQSTRQKNWNYSAGNAVDSRMNARTAVQCEGNW